MSGELVVLGILFLGMLVAIGMVIQTHRQRRDETPEDRRRRDKLDLERSRAWARKHNAAPRGALGLGIWMAGGAAYGGVGGDLGAADGAGGGDGGGCGGGGGGCGGGCGGA